MGSADSSDITVIVVTWQGRQLIGPTLDSLARQSVPHRTLVVDNGSTDGTADFLRERYPDVEVLALRENTGFAGGVAAALPQISSRYVALLNNDARADRRWLQESLAAFDRPDIAAVTAKMLLDDGTGSSAPPSAERPALINNAGVVLLRTGYGADRGLRVPDGPRFADPVEVFGFSGGAAVLRTLAVKAVGGFDRRLFMYYEDTDLSWRLRLAGWRIAYQPTAVVHHLHAASSDPDSQMFAFHNERNRLLVLLANAPVGFAVSRLMRFVITTASLTVRRLAGQQVAAQQVFRPALRMRVLGAVLARAAAVLAGRRRHYVAVGRGTVLRTWLGVEFRRWER